jgi:hypothetical protein
MLYIYIKQGTHLLTKWTVCNESAAHTYVEQLTMHAQMQAQSPRESEKIITRPGKDLRSGGYNAETSPKA